jgi:hypothetical protein
MSEEELIIDEESIEALIKEEVENELLQLEELEEERNKWRSYKDDEEN